MADANIPNKPEGAEELEKQGISDLVKALHDHTDPQVRQYAAYLLGQAKNPRAIQPLVEALADFDKSVREQAMLALSTIGKAAIEPLSEAMKEPQWETRYRAAEALGRIAALSLRNARAARESSELYFDTLKARIGRQDFAFDLQRFVNFCIVRQAASGRQVNPQGALLWAEISLRNALDIIGGDFLQALQVAGEPGIIGDHM